MLLKFQLKNEKLNEHIRINLQRHVMITLYYNGSGNIVYILYCPFSDKVHCNRDVTIEEGKRTLFTCGIRYNSSSLSNKMPELRWYQGNTPLSGSIIFGDNYVKHSLNLYPYATDHGRTYTCRALFDSPPPHHQQSCKVKLSVLCM